MKNNLLDSKNSSICLILLKMSLYFIKWYDLEKKDKKNKDT